MGLGLIATGVVNILFGFSSSLWAFALLWALNAFFQGWGSPVCARLLTAWYSRTERGGWWALLRNTAHNVGGALIPMVVGAAALHYGWRAGMTHRRLSGDPRRTVSVLAAARSPAGGGVTRRGRLASRCAGNRPAAGRRWDVS